MAWRSYGDEEETNLDAATRLATLSKLLEDRYPNE
jgi:hypothetical protein